MNHGMILFTNMKSYHFIKCKTILTLKVVSTETLDFSSEFHICLINHE